MTAKIQVFLTCAVTIAAAGCAQDGTGLSTASLSGDASKSAVTAAKVDPACATLASQIETLRDEGTIDKLEKASSGKSADVRVKRTALAKQAELNKAYADFQTRCGPTIPKAQTAAATPAPTAAAVQQAASNLAQGAATSAVQKVTEKAVSGAAATAVKAIAGQ